MMSRLTAIAIAAICSSALAQPSLTADADGSLNADIPVNAALRVTRTRRDVISVGELADELSSLRSTVNAMQSSASVFGGAHDFIETLLQTTITEARSIQVANTDALATTAGRVATVEASISTTQASQEALASSVTATASMLTASVTAQLASTTAEMTTNFNTLESTIGRDFNTMNTSLVASAQALDNRITRSVSTALTASASSLVAMNTSLNRQMAAKANTVRHIFLGKCNNHAYGGWREICHANTFTDTMAPKFRKASSTRFAALQRGIYQMSFHGIGESCGYQHAAAKVNGGMIYQTYMHTSSWWWKDQFVNQVTEILAGQQMWFEVHSGCGRLSAHAGTGHQRMEIVYLGAARAADI